MIFVFGSNLAGRHGKGAALQALHEYGAIRGVAEGIQGNAYGIPTKGHDLQPLPLVSIQASVKRFLEYAQSRPSTPFLVTRIGCGLAGYRDEDIAPMFQGLTRNVFVDKRWEEILNIRYGDDE